MKPSERARLQMASRRIADAVKQTEEADAKFLEEVGLLLDALAAPKPPTHRKEFALALQRKRLKQAELDAELALLTKEIDR